MRTIMLCGVHGVGKSRFIKDNKNFKDYSKYSCSKLIKDYSGLEFKNKKVLNVNNNQNILLDAAKHFVKDELVLYDGHITLFDKNRVLKTIDLEIFRDLKIDHFIMLKASPSIIHERLVTRDGQTWLTTKHIELAQSNEESKLIEYSNVLNSTYEIFTWNQIKNEWNS